MGTIPDTPARMDSWQGGHSVQTNKRAQRNVRLPRVKYQRPKCPKVRCSLRSPVNRVGLAGASPLCAGKLLVWKKNVFPHHTASIGESKSVKGLRFSRLAAKTHHRCALDRRDRRNAPRSLRKQMFSEDARWRSASFLLFSTTCTVPLHEVMPLCGAALQSRVRNAPTAWADVNVRFSLNSDDRPLRLKVRI